MESEVKRTLAEQITDRLFTNGCGDEAQRLVLELPGRRDGGGWCRTAVEDQINAVIGTLAADYLTEQRRVEMAQESAAMLLNKVVDLTAQLQRATGALELMYDKWEGGVSCQEADDEGNCFEGTSIGNAVKLSFAEEQEILNIIVEKPEPHEQACANCGKPYRAHLLHDGNKCGLNGTASWFPASIAAAITDSAPRIEEQGK